MRSLIILPLLASYLAGYAFGDQACRNNVETAFSQCESTYNAFDTDSATRAETCVAINEYISCVGDAYSCDESLADSWRNHLLDPEVWYHYGCDLPSASLGVASSAVVWGDPHFLMFNGAYAPCQATGNVLLASGQYWSVNATFAPVQVEASSNGSIVSNISVNFFHPAVPVSTSSFMYSLFDVPNSQNVTVNEDETTKIAVRTSSVTAPFFGLTIFVESFVDDGFLQVGIVAKGLTGGALLTGCAAETNPEARVFNQAAVPSDLCAQLYGDFKTSCAYDNPRMGPTWAALSSAQAQIFSVTTVREELEKQNAGIKSSASVHAASWICVFISVVFGVTILW